MAVDLLQVLDDPARLHEQLIDPGASEDAPELCDGGPTDGPPHPSHTTRAHSIAAASHRKTRSARRYVATAIRSRMRMPA